MYKTTFFNFIAYMIYKISNSHGLELLFSSHCDSATWDLFLKLLVVQPIPRLFEIKVNILLSIIALLCITFLLCYFT